MEMHCLIFIISPLKFFNPASGVGHYCALLHSGTLVFASSCSKKVKFKKKDYWILLHYTTFSGVPWSEMQRESKKIQKNYFLHWRLASSLNVLRKDNGMVVRRSGRRRYRSIQAYYWLNRDASLMGTHNNPCGWFDTATFDSDLRVTESPI